MSTNAKHRLRLSAIIATLGSSVYGIMTVIDPVLAIKIGMALGTFTKGAGLCT